MFISKRNNWNLVIESESANAVEVVSRDWGGVKLEDVHYLVQKTAKVFWGCFENPSSTSIRVEYRPSHGTPEVECYDKINNVYLVTITTQDYRVLPYQLAHELCHVASKYNEFNFKQNIWFHETLCEVASIYIVRKMSSVCPERVYFSNLFSDYAKELMQYPNFTLPNNCSLPEWFSRNETTLRADPLQRDKNRFVALHLLPLFESIPKNWRSVCYLPDTPETFQIFLCEWKANVPKPFGRFIEQVIGLFGFVDEPTSQPKCQ